MHVDPPAISILQPMTPPALDRVVKMCLAKDPDERWQTAHDVLLQLRWIAESGAQAANAPQAPLAARRHNRERLAWGLALAVVALIAAVMSLVAFRPAPAPPEMRVEITTPSTPDTVSFAISPDGRQLVFVASGGGPSRLWLRPLDALEAQPLAGTENASYPFWSPDSRSISFFAGGKLKRLDIGGRHRRSPTRRTSAGERGARTA